MHTAGAVKKKQNKVDLHQCLSFTCCSNERSSSITDISSLYLIIPTPHKLVSYRQLHFYGEEKRVNISFKPNQNAFYTSLTALQCINCNTQHDIALIFIPFPLLVTDNNSVFLQMVSCRLPCWQFPPNLEPETQVTQAHHLPRLVPQLKELQQVTAKKGGF